MKNYIRYFSMKPIKVNYLFNLGLMLAFVVTLLNPAAGGLMFLGLVGTRFQDTSKANAFNPQGIASYGTIAYAASVNLPTPVQPALRHYYDFATLTGAITVNATAAMIAQLRDGDEVFLRFTSSGTFAVTNGTNIRGAAGPSLTVGQFSVVHLIFMDSKLTVLAVSTPAV